MARKGIVLAAGYGTRFLPVTRVVPKELLPVVDTPCLQLVVDELAGAGVTDLLLITSRRKRAVEDWFDHDPELEAAVAANAAKAAKAAPPGVSVTVIRQAHMGGTGDAIALARDFAGDDPLVVAFPDDLFGDPNPTAALLDAHDATGAAVLAVQDLSGQDVSAYGVVDGRPEGDLVRVRDVVEKPAPGTEPSHLVSVGRYLYTPALLDALIASKATHPPGEWTPMPAMRAVASEGGLVAVPVTAPRWDTGTPAGYLRAVVDHALARDDVGPDFLAYLRDVVGKST